MSSRSWSANCYYAVLHSLDQYNYSHINQLYQTHLNRERGRNKFSSFGARLGGHLRKPLCTPNSCFTLSPDIRGFNKIWYFTGLIQHSAFLSLKVLSRHRVAVQQNKFMSQSSHQFITEHLAWGGGERKKVNENEREAGSAPWRESVDSLCFPVLRLVVIKYRKITVLASFGANVLSRVSCV